MAQTTLKILLDSTANPMESKSDKMILSDKQIASTFENDSSICDEDFIVDDECTHSK